MSALFAACITILCLAAGSLMAGPKISVSSSGDWVQRIPFDPPNEQHTQWEITGKSGRSIPGSSSEAALTGVETRLFSLEDGSATLTADSPDCVFDIRQALLYSGARLTVNAQSGRYFLDGTGYQIQQTNSLLFVSNDVHSIIRNVSSDSTNLISTDIRSKSCEFHMPTTAKDGVAIYRESVRVKNPQLEMICEQLTAQVPSTASRGAPQLRQIVAETAVEIVYAAANSEKIHGVCSRAVYGIEPGASETNSTLEMTGDPRIELPLGWISADKLVLNRADNTIHGEKNVHLHLSRIPSLTSLAANAGAATNSLDVYSDVFDFDRNINVATFLRHVVANDPQFRLRSGSLTVDIPSGQSAAASRPPDHLVAETNVTIDFGTAHSDHATGDKAVYEVRSSGGHTNEWLELTGNPSLTLSNTVMTADIIEANRTTGEVQGAGHHHAVRIKQSGEAEPLHTEVFSDSFTYSTNTGLSVYQGNVRAYDPAMNFSGSKVTIQMAKPQAGRTNHVASMLAEGGVVMLYADKPFAPGDITNLSAMADSLRQPSNSVAAYARESFDAKTKALLSSHTSAEDQALKEALAGQLNLLTLQEGLAPLAFSSGLTLSAKTSALAATHPRGAEWVQLNRLILLDAFHGSLFANQKGDLTRGTGDHAVYQYHVANNATNETVELIGHPRVEKPGWWMTADDRILSDRVTGITRAYPRMHFHGFVEDFSPTPVPQGKPKAGRPAK